MAQRRFGNVLSTRLGDNINRENPVARSKLTTQREPQRAATRSTLGDIGNFGNNGKVYTKAQKELNVHARRPLQKSKAATSETATTTTATTATTTKIKIEPEKIEKMAVTEPMDLDNVNDVVEEVAEAFKNVEITDIDADDFGNPQLCAEYANEIYRYLFKYEKEFAVPDYIKEQKQVNERMRAILIDWLVQVHEKFRLLQETLYLTVSFVDRYLAKEVVARNELQLVGVTAMLLASKYEEMYAPEIGDFVYITDHAYDKARIRKTEANMFKVLDYKLGEPLCLHFLRRNSKAAQADAEKHTMAKYFMELMLIDYESVSFPPSMKAAGALCLAMKLIDGSEWTPVMEHYSSHSAKALKPCTKRIAELVLRGKNKDSKLTAVTLKYSKHKFLKVSLSPKLESNELLTQAGDV